MRSVDWPDTVPAVSPEVVPAFTLERRADSDLQAADSGLQAAASDQVQGSDQAQVSDQAAGFAVRARA